MSPVHRLNRCSDGIFASVHKVDPWVQLSQRFDNPKADEHLVEVNPMSGGLLEKAKQVSGDSDDDVGAAADAVIETKTVPNPSDQPLMLYAAGGSLLVCMVLLYFMYL